MRKYLLLISILLVFAGIAYAQDNVWRESDGLEYNCTTLVEVLQLINEETPIDDISLGDAPLLRSSDNSTELSLYEYIGASVMTILTEDADAEITVAEIFAAAVSACIESDDEESSTSEEETTSSSTSVEAFNVVVSGDVNLRSCGDTTCDVVGQAADGSILTVVGEDGDWYEVETDDGTAFIASWLTTRGPDEVISTDDVYRDAELGCAVAFDVRRGDMGITLILAGDDRNDVVADVYRPNETNPLRVAGQLDKTFIDTGEPYIQQYYSFNVSWPNGTYRLEITMDDETRILAWELETRGDYNIYVVCE
jgi:hypothetical protein